MTRFLRRAVVALSGTLFVSACSLLANYDGVFGGASAGDAAGGEAGSPEGGTVDLCDAAFIAQVGIDDACQRIGRFLGTQVVDGVNEEFCGLPETVFALNDAGGPSATAPPSYADAVGHIWVGYSADALHIFVHVDETNVSPAVADAGLPLYLGDGIEIFASGPQTHPTGPYQQGTEDIGPTHILIGVPPEGGPVWWSGFNSATVMAGTGLQSPDAGQYTAKQVAGGYNVEAMIPWGVLQATTVYANDNAHVPFLIGIDQRGGTNEGYSAFFGFVQHGGVKNCTSSVFDGGRPACDDLTWCTPVIYE